VRRAAVDSTRPSRSVLGRARWRPSGLATCKVIPPPVLTKILEPDPAVGAHHAARNLIRLQQPDQVRSGHVQEIGRLLCGQFNGFSRKSPRRTSGPRSRPPCSAR